MLNKYTFVLFFFYFYSLQLLFFNEFTFPRKAVFQNGCPSITVIRRSKMCIKVIKKTKFVVVIYLANEYITLLPKKYSSKSEYNNLASNVGLLKIWAN